MKSARIVVDLNRNLLRRVDARVARRTPGNRSCAVQLALDEMLGRIAATRLARECAKLDRREEQLFAEGRAGATLSTL